MLYGVRLPDNFPVEGDGDGAGWGMLWGDCRVGHVVDDCRVAHVGGKVRVEHVVGREQGGACCGRGHMLCSDGQKNLFCFLVILG